MDQRSHDVEEDLKRILHTRVALADKIQLLERQVEDTVYMTKSAAFDALDLARNKAVDFIQAATDNLNPSTQGRRRPWMMVGSAVAVGFFAGVLEQRRRSRVYPYYPPSTHAADVMPSKSEGERELPSGVYPFYGREKPRTVREAPRSEFNVKDDANARMSDLWRPLRGLWNEVAGELAAERDRLQQAAIYAGRSFIHDAVRVFGELLLDQLNRAGSSLQHQGRRRF